MDDLSLLRLGKFALVVIMRRAVDVFFVSHVVLLVVDIVVVLGDGVGRHLRGFSR